jgi:hypothetical protein
MVVAGLARPLATGARCVRSKDGAMSKMSGREDRINQNALFLPMTGSYLAEDSDATLPCIVVGGVQVYAYFKGGELVVSVDYDTADDQVVNDRGCVPTRVTLSGEEVHYEP